MENCNKEARYYYIGIRTRNISNYRVGLTKEEGD